MCQKNCGATVAAALKAVRGVKDVEVSFVKSAAFIKYSLDGVSLGHFSMTCIDAVEAVGFDCVRMEETPPALVLSVDGMMCNNSCTPTVYNAIISASPDEITHAVVSLEKGEAYVWGKIGAEEGKLSPRAIIDAIEVTGFGVAVKEGGGDMEDKEKNESSSRPKVLQAASAMPKENGKEYDGEPDSAAWEVNSANAHLSYTEVSIIGMSCASCVRSVETGLQELPGVVNVRIALLLEKAEVLFDPALLDPGQELIQSKVQSLGYKCTVVLTKKHGDLPKRCVMYSCHDLSSPSCAIDIEGALLSYAGVHSAKVDVILGLLVVRLSNKGEEGADSASVSSPTRTTTQSSSSGPSSTSSSERLVCRGARDVVDIVARVGHRVTYLSEVEHGGDKDDAGLLAGYANTNNMHGSSGDVQGALESEDLQQWTRLLVIALALGVPVVLLHVLTMVSRSVRVAMMEPSATAVCGHGLTLGQLVMLTLNLPLQISVGGKFYRQAYLSAKHGTFGMDFLVVTGTSITFVYSLITMIIACGVHIPTKHIFFEASGMLLMFVTLGKWLESYSRTGTMNAIGALLKLQPKTALLVTSYHEEEGSAASTTSPGNPSSTVGTSASGGSEGEDIGEHSSEEAFFTNTDVSISRATRRRVARVERPNVYYGSTVKSKKGRGSRIGANSSSGAGGGLSESSTHGQVMDVEETRIELLQRGDVLKILPGSGVPTDGYILSGHSFIDESMITGESKPVKKLPGDFVFGSTINTGSGFLLVQVSSLGGENALSQIVKLVHEAQMSKAPVQKYADQIAGVFTPFVLTISFITFFTWLSLCLTHTVPQAWYDEEYGDPYLFSMLFAISVVVISCPCALGLATPTAIMVGTAVGADLGVLIKGGPAFETAHQVDCVLLDKTGTLTQGKPTTALDDIQPETSDKSPLGHLTVDMARDVMLLLAATVEGGSEHPLAKAIVQAALDRGMTPGAIINPEDCVNIPGQGLTLVYRNVVSLFLGLNHRGTLEHGNSPQNGGHSYLNPESSVFLPSLGSEDESEAELELKIAIGNRRLMGAIGANISINMETELLRLEQTGRTAVVLAVNSQVCGVMGVADPVKADAATCISALRNMGLDVWMVTGDNRTTAEAVASKLNMPLDRVVADCMPNDKVKTMHDLRGQGKHVAMVGDGINDSPALAAADLGIAIGAGTQIAMDAADMVLVRSNVSDVAVALDLAKKTFARVQLNFLWAFIYNLIAIPFAAGMMFPFTHTLVPPQYAGLSMALSSVSVVLNSSALRFYRPPIVRNSDSSDHNTHRSGALSKDDVDGGSRYIVPVSSDDWDDSSTGAGDADNLNMDESRRDGVAKATWGAGRLYSSAQAVARSGTVNPLYAQVDSFEV